MTVGIIGFFKLNFDGASKGNPSPAGFGGVFQHDKGYIKWIYAGFLGIESNNTDELYALEFGLWIAMRQGYTRIVAKGDSRVIIHMFKKIQNVFAIRRAPKNQCLEEGLEKIAKTLSLIPVVIPSHVRRTTNKVVDRLTNDGVSRGQNILDED